MTLNGLDHALVAMLVMVLPYWAVREYGRFQRAVDKGTPGVKVRQYRRSVRNQWMIAAFVLALWAWRGRPWDALGLGLSFSWRFWVALASVAAAITVLWRQLSLVRSDPEVRAQLAHQIEPVRALLPADRGELAWFNRLALTAGICEELVFRGYLIWYLARFTPLWVAAVLASFIFGLGHTYQGRSGIIKTTVVGLVMAGLYLLSGSLWLPMVLHAAVDLINGRTGHELLVAEAAG